MQAVVTAQITHNISSFLFSNAQYIDQEVYGCIWGIWKLLVTVTGSELSLSWLAIDIGVAGW